LSAGALASLAARSSAAAPSPSTVGPRRLAGGSEQWDRSGFIPACSRCRFFAENLLNLFVDKVLPEAELLVLLLDCAAEPAPRG